MKLPSDPYILVSVLNTKLRDQYSSLEKLCDEEDLALDEVCLNLSFIGYLYDDELNQFIKR